MRTGGLITAFSVGTTLIAMSAAHAAGVSAPPTQNKDWRQAWRATRDAQVERNPRLAYDPTSLLVRFRTDADKACIDAAKASAGLHPEPIETWKLVPSAEHLAVLPGVRVEHAIKVLTASPCVEVAEPDHFGSVNVIPNDFYFSKLWGMHNTGQSVYGNPGTAGADTDANLAWDITTGNNVAVGVCDTGIRRTHADLAANIWSNPGEVPGNGVDDDGNGRTDDTWGWNFWSNNNNPTDDHGHGTHVAGTIGAKGNNGIGVAGVAWNVKLAALRIGNASGTISTSAAIGAMDYCRSKGIRISNHSWSMTGYNQIFYVAINNCRTSGHILCAAAGNGGSDARGDNNDYRPAYPASYNLDNIIAVAAVDNDDRLCSFSNYGAASVDIGAPGETILSTSKAHDNGYVGMTGTSMATPHVAGAAALVWGRYPSWTYAQVRTRILNSRRPIPSLTGKCTSGGCLNLNNAVQ
ncbi:MAG TPA: S8 family peptidase [Phycisphaerales bacterium]|nr:S8 family peptidase [Phycisphaerales bacterium]